jgi:PAS domain S-box-containing protein
MISKDQIQELFDVSFKVLADMSPTGIFLTDIAGKCLYVNPAWCRMAGLTCEEAYGDGWVKAIHPEERTRIFSEWESFIRGEIPWESEHRFIDNVGKITWVYGVATLLKGSDGLAEVIIGININITERKKYKTELKESEERLRLASNATDIVLDNTELKKSEIALKRSHEWQKSIFEGSLDAIFISDEDSVLIAVNKAACDLTGYSKEQLLKMRIPDLHDEPDLEAYRKYFKRIFKGEKILSEAKVLRRDGTKVDTEFNNSLISVSGRLYMHTTARDITERKIAEEKLKASEAEYRSLFENSIMGISQSYPGGSYKRINNAYVNMYGYPDIATMFTEVSGNTKILFSNPDDRNRVLETLDKSGYMAPTEFELNRRNGEIFWALVAAKQVKDNSGKLLYLQAEHIDITNQKKLEKEKYLTLLYARNLIEASLDPLATIGIDGKITDVNVATEQITGLKREKLIGTDFAEYFTNPEKVREEYKTIFKSGIVRNYPLSILHTSGKKIDVLFNATLFKNETGEVQGVFAAARDITDRKKMEDELRKSKELLEKLNQHLMEVRENERNQIALNLHDDLGQKLTAINLDIAWLKSRIGVQSKTVREKFEEMSGMIKETIESIKETSSFLRPAILFDLGLVPAINSQLTNFEKQTGIKCHFYFKPEEFLLEDRLSLILYRILQESLTNIARHSGATKAEVNLNIIENKIEMIIKDDGRGIEKDKVNSLKSMGIAGIKERVKSVHGKITFSGENGSGTRIKVLIPLLVEKDND